MLPNPWSPTAIRASNSGQLRVQLSREGSIITWRENALISLIKSDSNLPDIIVKMSRDELPKVLNYLNTFRNG